MSTTFERVAKIIKEETVPANAVESAFASLAISGDVQTEIDALKIAINKATVNPVDNARHIPGGTATPLTLLHFSDPHADADAVNRIVAEAAKYSTIDGMICTGDMRGNTGGAISSWWNKDIMTCVGNHDSATYSAETGYDWTAVSMANRDAYYIAPFKSNWGITHTSGKSYYYKDYATQNVRLIVMDGMLYIGESSASDASAQTSWLEGLLADAITNNLHVVIAIHAPHGGAAPVPCSFTKYGRDGNMPTYSDCNTPQSVIDAVAAKISSGLHFIGYLCGHTHQDDVWDAENNGKQLMFSITCAATAQTAQWINHDMDRSHGQGAYNVVTIDTANTLVKIVRGGGANIDDHMRPRTEICFNYSTGEIVSESQAESSDAKADESTALKAFPTDTATGDPASFTDGANVPLKSLKLAISATQSGSGDPTPDNVRPFSGETEATIQRTIKNLVNQLKNIKGSKTNSYYVDITSGSGDISTVHLVADTTYTLSFDITSSVIPFVISVGAGNGTYAKEVAVGTSDLIINYNGRVSVTFTPSSSQLSSGDILAFRAPRYDSAQSYSYSVSNIQLEIGSSATDYVPYGPATIPVSWESEVGTIYGGTVDVVNGTVDFSHMLVTFNGSDDEEWTRYTGGSAGSYAMQLILPHATIPAANVGIFANYLTGISNNASWGSYDTFISTNASNNIICGIRTITTVEAWKEYLSEHPLQVLYPIDPKRRYITPTEINAFYGSNSISADTGAVTVVYRADPTLYIGKKLDALGS